MDKRSFYLVCDRILRLAPALLCLIALFVAVCLPGKYEDLPLGRITSFDVGDHGEFVLLFQSGSGVCVGIFDQNGTLTEGREIPHSFSGTVSCRFDDDGNLALLHARDKGYVWVFDGESLQKKADADSESFQTTKVYPCTQRGEVTRSAGNSVYTFQSPGFFAAVFCGDGSSLSASEGDTLRTLWTDHGYSARAEINQILLLLLLFLYILSAAEAFLAARLGRRPQHHPWRSGEVLCCGIGAGLMLGILVYTANCRVLWPGWSSLALLSAVVLWGVFLCVGIVRKLDNRAAF